MSLVTPACALAAPTAQASTERTRDLVVFFIWDTWGVEPPRRTSALLRRCADPPPARSRVKAPPAAVRHGRDGRPALRLRVRVYSRRSLISQPSARIRTHLRFPHPMGDLPTTTSVRPRWPAPS